MAAPLHPITYGGTLWSPNTDGAASYLELREGFYESAETSGDDDERVGGTGMFERNHPAIRRRITLMGRIIGTGATDILKAAAHDTEAAAMRASFQEGVTKVLSMDLGSGSTATINARTEGREFDRVVGWVSIVTIVLISVDPDWVIT